MHESRCYAACSVFEGKIVVSKGYSNSVEAFDYNENKWTYLLNMIKKDNCMLQLACLISCLLLVVRVLRVVKFFTVFQESLL